MIAIQHVIVHKSHCHDDREKVMLIEQLCPLQLSTFVWRYIRDKKRYLLFFLCIAVIWSTCLSLGPYLLKVIIDTLTQSKGSNVIGSILGTCCLYVLLSLVMNINFRVFNYLNLRIQPALKASVYQDMMTYVLHHSLGFFQEQHTGTLNRKIADMADNIEPLLMVPMHAFVPQIMAITIASFTLLHVTHAILGLVLLGWVILYVLFSAKVIRPFKKLSQQTAEARARIGGVLGDILANHMSIKLFDTVAYESAQLDHHLQQFVYRQRQFTWYNLKVNFFQELAVTLLIGVMMVLLLQGFSQGWVTVGDFAMVLTLSLSLTSALSELSQQMQFYANVVGTCQQALSIIVPHDMTDKKEALPINITRGEIKFDHITFYYASQKPLFNALQVIIRPGEKVGLVGYSGGGKSTFFKLILRLVDPQEGTIFIDGHELKNITRSSLVRQIAAIQQEPELFHRSVLDNIRYGQLDASEDDIIAVAKKARCHDFIMALPQQYQSLIGERGVKLSGGQKQRIAIARAFLKKAPILLLDEATSSLDSLNEHLVQEALEAILLDRTTLVIAHRLSTLQKMDRILVFVEGQIVEDGSIETLLSHPEGHFYRLWHAQTEGFIP